MVIDRCINLFPLLVQDFTIYYDSIKPQPSRILNKAMFKPLNMMFHKKCVVLNFSCVRIEKHEL